jgi:hypothetical protein
VVGECAGVCREPEIAHMTTSVLCGDLRASVGADTFGMLLLFPKTGGW